MAKILYYTAFSVNVLAIFAILFFMATQARSHEYLIFIIFLLPPVLAVVALYDGPSLKEKALHRKLNIAKMEKELSEL